MIHYVILSQRMTTFEVFVEYFSCNHFYALVVAFSKESKVYKILRFATIFTHLLLLSVKKAKFIRFCAIFHLKQEKRLSSESASLQFRSKPVQQTSLSFLKHIKKQCTRRLSETKPTSTNASASFYMKN